MLQVLYQRYPLLVHLCYSLLLLLTATAFQPGDEKSYTSAAHAEAIPPRESADPIQLLSELSKAFAEDSAPLTRILGASPASLSRLMSRESSPTPEFGQRLSSTHRLYLQSGRDTRILRQQLDPEYKWYEYVLHYPLLYPLHPLLLVLVLLILYRLHRHPLVLILPLFTLFFLWIVALIYTSLTPCRDTHDHYRQQLNPKVELPLEARRPS
ncbi:hypothetical protein [Porphyromonas sp.]